MTRDTLETAKKLFFILLGIDIAITVIVGLNAFATIGTLKNIQSGTQTVDQSLLSSFAFWDGFSKLILLTMIAVGVGLVKWLNSCYNFAKGSLGATGFKNEGWTTFGWIIPIFNFFKPYQIISEIYRTGAPNYTESDGWKKENGSALLLTWWIFWVVTHFIGTIIGKQLLRGAMRDDVTLQQAIDMTELQAWSCIISIIIAGAWLIVATELTKRLLDRAPIFGQREVISLQNPVTHNLPSIPMSSKQAPHLAPATISDPNPTTIGPGAIAVNEEQVYATIAQELETGLTDKGLWTRLFAECGGDDKRTKVLYIKHRADRLIAAEHSRLEHAARERVVESARVEKIRLQGLSLREKLMEGNITREFSDQIHALSNSQTAVTLWHKVRTNRFDDVAALLDEDPRLVAVTNSDGDTLLHVAVYERSSRMIQLLLERGAPPDAKNIYGVTPISYASKAGEEELVELLTVFAS